MKNIQQSKSLLHSLKELENTRNDDFSAIPHCTNPHCPNFHHDHHEHPEDTSWYTDHGTYTTKAFGTVRRYRCRHCGKTFSPQSFSLNYYVKKPVSYISLLEKLFSTSGQGNITRFTRLRCELIENRYERMARMLLAIQADLRSSLDFTENYVLDGFESFSRSQYYPNNVNILVGDKSEFIYGMGFSQLRRKGRMSSKQKEKRSLLEQQYGKAPRNAIEKSVATLLYNLCISLHDKKIGTRILKTDQHKAYEWVYDNAPDIKRYLVHLQVPSTLPRFLSNPLFPVNYVDRQFRKDQANHVRETVQFARCPSAMMIRMSLYQVYHNFIMPRRVREQRKGNWQTRCEYLGLAKSMILDVFERYWGKRPFFGKTALWQEEKTTWLLEWRNSRIPVGRRIPKYIAI